MNDEQTTPAGEASRVAAFIGALEESHGTRLPGLGFEIIPAESDQPANRTPYEDPARKGERGTLLRAGWTTRNGKLAYVRRNVILQTWGLDEARAVLDEKAMAHERRESYTLTFDPMALAILRHRTGRDADELETIITSVTSDHAIAGLFDAAAAPTDAESTTTRPREGLILTSHAPRDANRYGTTLRLSINKGRVNIRMTTPRTNWTTSQAIIDIPSEMSEVVMEALVGRPLGMLFDAPFVEGFVIRKAYAVGNAKTGRFVRVEYRRRPARRVRLPGTLHGDSTS